jgi:hypothetical protein
MLPVDYKSVFFFGVITFVTVCTKVGAAQEHSHTGNHIVMVVVVVQVDFLLGCRNRKSATIQRTARPGPLCTTEYNTRQPS